MTAGNLRRRYASVVGLHVFQPWTGLALVIFVTVFLVCTRGVYRRDWDWPIFFPILCTLSVPLDSSFRLVSLLLSCGVSLLPAFPQVEDFNLVESVLSCTLRIYFMLSR